MGGTDVARVAPTAIDQQTALKAERFARLAFADRLDRQGLPYIGHLERVAAAVPLHARAAAWLHDIFEDTTWSATKLRLGGIPERVIMTVQILTRTASETSENYAAYIDRVRASGNADAILIKRADLNDNLRPGLPPEIAKPLHDRYHAALARLTE